MFEKYIIIQLTSPTTDVQEHILQHLGAIGLKLHLCKFYFQLCGHIFILG